MYTRSNSNLTAESAIKKMNKADSLVKLNFIFGDIILEMKPGREFMRVLTRHYDEIKKRFVG